MAIQALKGVNDILPDEIAAWSHVEHTLAHIFRAYGYRAIRVPIIEERSLFVRSIGEETDIVEKEIYSFTDRGGRDIALRPEATASVVRAYLQHRMASQGMVKLYYHGAMFRGERPQAGRNRQFFQMGVEAIGCSAAYLDAEVIELAACCLRELGLKSFEIILNSVGCRDDKRAFAELLRAFLEPRQKELCQSCQRRLARNILRVLDCKNPACGAIVHDAPAMADHQCAACREHFQLLTGTLDRLAVTYRIDPHLVRGLDYYTKTVFEIVHSGLGAQNSLCAGGRYDNLVAELGGEPTGAMGFAFGLERLLLAGHADHVPFPENAAPSVYGVGLGDAAYQAVTALVRDLRHQGVSTVIGYEQRSLKSHLKQADKAAVRFSLIIGDNELASGTVLVRDMRLGTQESLASNSVLEYIKQVLQLPAQRCS